MRQITLLPAITGNENYITIRDSIRATRNLPNESYLIGSEEVNATNLEDLATAFDAKLPELIPDEMKSVYQTFIGDREVNWLKALGVKGLQKNLLKYRESLLPIVEKMEAYGYVDTLIKGRTVFEHLQPVRVDTMKVRSLIDGGTHLNSFLPKTGSYCEPIRYSHGSRTGRLTVKSGPRVLTLSKENRGILKSRYPNGSIYIIDFICLEPRLALYATGRKSEIDIYGEIANITGETRAKSKIATLSFIFGASSHDYMSDNLKRYIHNHFAVNSLLRTIVDCEGRNGFGRNLHVEEERHLIPHWVQSTAVDVCLLGFSDLVKKIENLADPLFLVHDALFIDIPENNLRLISDIVKEGLMVSPYGHFPVSLKSLCDAE